MSRIRVRVEVQPWSEPTEVARDPGKARQEVIKPYLEPCAEDVTINELAEKIVNRFRKVHRG